MGSVVIVVLIAVLAVALIVAAIAVVRRTRRTRPTPAEGAAATGSTIAPAAPMVGLEAALDSVTDRSGRRLREKLEAEAAVVDDLRVSDDTGPLLRRALDRVEHHDHPTGEPTAQPTDGATPSTTDT